MVLATRLNDFIGLQRLWWFCLCQGTIAAQFNCEGTTLSGVEFELSGSGYRVSLVKRRFVSGGTSNFRRFKQLCPFLSNSSNRKLCVSLSGKLSSVKSLKCSFFRYWFLKEWILQCMCVHFIPFDLWNLSMKWAINTWIGLTSIREQVTQFSSLYHVFV